MPFNNEQLKSMVRWFMTTVGGAFAGWFAAKGFLSADQIMSILTSETVIGVAVSVIGLVWSMFSRSKVGILTAAASIPEVQKIEIAPMGRSIEAVKETERLATATPPLVQVRIP